MGRYARAVYGTGKYGLDLRAEHSVEPMTATIEVDTAILPASIQQGSSAISGPNGQSIYDRVMVTWLAPKDITRYVLMRSNVGFPTGPTDPWAKTLMGSTDPLEGARVSRFPSDPSGRERLGYLDEFVEQGREYFYSYWVMTGVEDTNGNRRNSSTVNTTCGAGPSGHPPLSTCSQPPSTAPEPASTGRRNNGANALVPSSQRARDASSVSSTHGIADTARSCVRVPQNDGAILENSRSPDRTTIKPRSTWAFTVEIPGELRQ